MDKSKMNYTSRKSKLRAGSRDILDQMTKDQIPIYLHLLGIIIIAVLLRLGLIVVLGELVIVD